MGNTASSEASRKINLKSQKLSKPRAANNVPTNGMLSHSSLSIGSSARYSSSYLAASLPITPVDPQFPGGNAIPEDAIQEHQGSSRRLSRRGSQWMSETPVPPVPESPLLDTRDGRCHSFYADPRAARRQSRTNSVIYNDADPLLPGRKAGTVFVWKSEIQAATAESYREMQQMTQTANRTPQQGQVAGGNLPRANSDLSMYAPVRRRSVIQTPGIATRQERETLPSAPNRSKSKSRRSLPPPALEQPSSQLSRAKAPKRISMPPRPAEIQPQERAATPCDLDYQQLGGHKFGSLRITNGCPSSPAPEKGQRPSSRPDSRPRSSYAKDVVTEAQYQAGGRAAQLKTQNRSANPNVNLFVEKQSRDKIQQISSAPPALNPVMANEKRPRRSPIPDFSGSPQINIQPALANDHNITEHSQRHQQQTITKKSSNSAMTCGRGHLTPSRESNLSRSDSGVGSTSSEASRQTLSKADSGYSSNVSLRSLQSSSQLQEFSKSLHPDAGSQNLYNPKLRRSSEKLTPNPAGYDRLGKSNNRSFSAGGKPIATDDFFQDTPKATRTSIPEKETKSNGRYNRGSNIPQRFSHRNEPSRTTLNTILSVDSTTPQVGDDIRDVTFESPPRPASSLKKRRSFHAVADFAQAATSKIPSLKLRNRKSATDNPFKPEQKLSTEKVDGRRTAPENLEHRQRGLDGNLFSSTNPFRTEKSPAKPPSEPSRTPPGSRGRSQAQALRGRASAPDLYPSTPNQRPTSSERSPHSKLRSQSPKVQRSRGMMDSGVPPPIPAQFRTSQYIASLPRPPSQIIQQGTARPFSVQNPEMLAHDPNSQWQREYMGVGQIPWRRSVVRPGHYSGAVAPGHIDQQSPQYLALHSYNPPAHNGVPIRS
ncbi:hypothetical protein PT974_09300 [Cladobotryum mycophilum]|uniref:Proteophosphoglycan ppg4 n=1 Tax=Cladobotryum mycophilum TaxID=491253 RepID=A0ABR0SGB1_9HYPO